MVGAGAAKKGHLWNLQPLDYVAWRARELRDRAPTTLEPVAAFELDSKNERVTVALDHVRTTRYVVLRPTNFRAKPTDYTKHFLSKQIEIRFFGVSGQIL